MKRFLFGLAMLAVWTNAGFAQTKEIQEQLDKQLKDLRTEDELLRQALSFHPDVMVAQAKRQVAEAELAQVKLAVAQKQSKLKSELVMEENTLRASRTSLDHFMNMRKKGVVSDPEVLNAEAKVQFTQARLSQLSSELQDAMPAAKNASAPHPDVLVATAKLQVADAELAQTKLVISQKIATLKAEIDAQKQKLAMYESAYNEMQKLHQAGAAPKAEVMPAQIRLLESRTALTRLSSELKGMTTLTQSRAVQEFPITPRLAKPTIESEAPLRVEYAIRSLANNPTPGSPAEKIKNAIGLPIRYVAKSKQAEIVLKDLQKAAGLDVMFRISDLTPGKLWKEEKTTVTVDAELTFAAWIELILDEINMQIHSPNASEKYEAYVRDYGLLVAHRSSAPADAITLSEFARQVRAEKEKEKAATEPKKP